MMHSPFEILLVAAAAVPALTTSTLAQYCSANQSVATTKYPNKCQIAQIFNNLSEGNSKAFFAHVAPDVDWTLMGTHPLAGVYHNRTIFLADAVMRLDNTIVNGTGTLDLVHIVGGGDEEWSANELHALGVCKNGEYSLPYPSSSPTCLSFMDLARAFEPKYMALTSFMIGLKYDNRFKWVTRWNTEGIIVEVRAWVDSALIYKAITENESPEYTYTDQRTALEPGPVGVGCATQK
jgi:ketosteroid isomerase-like protein